LSCGADGQPWQLNAPLQIADPCHDQRLAMLHDLLERSEAGTLLIVPLHAGGQLLGTLNLADSTARHFDDVDLDLAQALAGYAATVFDNQRLRETVLQAERTKSAILDAVSHEFRTPITAVLGFTELYQEQVLGPVTEEQQEALDDIHRNAHRLLKLVDDLLDLARLEAGRLDMSLYPVEVGLCITEAAALMAAQFQQKQLDLRLEIVPQQPPAEVSLGSRRMNCDDAAAQFFHLPLRVGGGGDKSQQRRGYDPSRQENRNRWLHHKCHLSARGKSFHAPERCGGNQQPGRDQDRQRTDGPPSQRAGFRRRGGLRNHGGGVG
jgi:signal transduction histidine kinase